MPRASYVRHRLTINGYPFRCGPDDRPFSHDRIHEMTTINSTLEAERAEILRLDEAWSAAAAGLDVDHIVSFWSDDATVLPPGAPALVGKAAIREFVAASLGTPGFSIT